MIEIIALIKIALKLKYFNLLEKILDSKLPKDEFLDELVKWIKDYYKVQKELPSYDYVETKFKAMESIPLLQDKDEQFYLSYLHDKTVGFEISDIRANLASISQYLTSDYDKASELYDKMRESIFGLKNKPKSVDIFSSKSSIYQLYKQQLETGGALLGVRAIDDHCRGLKLGTMTTVFGFTGSFKTTLAVSSAYYNAMMYKSNVGYITLEIPKHYLKYMLISRHSLHPKFAGVLDPIPYKDIYDGILTEKQEQDLQIIEEDLASDEYGFIYIFDVSDFPISKFEEYISAIDAELDILILDYIQLCGYSGDAMNKTANVNLYTKRFHDFTQLYRSGKGLSGILLAQANRDGWKKAVKDGGKYSLLALSDGSELERSSFSVISLFSTPAMVNQNLLSMQLLKFRSGVPIIEPLKVNLDPAFALIGDQLEVNYEELVEDLF